MNEFLLAERDVFFPTHLTTNPGLLMTTVRVRVSANARIGSMDVCVSVRRTDSRLIVTPLSTTRKALMSAEYLESSVSVNKSLVEFITHK